MPAERTPHADDSLLAAPLLALTEWALRAPATVLVGACALALLSVAITANGLSFKTSRLDLPIHAVVQPVVGPLPSSAIVTMPAWWARAERGRSDRRDRRFGQSAGRKTLLRIGFLSPRLIAVKAKALIPSAAALRSDRQQLTAATALLPATGESGDRFSNWLASMTNSPTSASPREQRTRMERSTPKQPMLLAGLGGTALPAHLITITARRLLRTAAVRSNIY